MYRNYKQIYTHYEDLVVKGQLYDIDNTLWEVMCITSKGNVILKRYDCHNLGGILVDYVPLDTLLRKHQLAFDVRIKAHEQTSHKGSYTHKSIINVDGNTVGELKREYVDD